MRIKRKWSQLNYGTRYLLSHKNIEITVDREKEGRLSGFIRYPYTIGMTEKTENELLQKAFDRVKNEI